MLSRFLAALLGALLLVACDQTGEVQTAAQRIATFHEDYGKGDVDAIYASGNDVFRASVTRADLGGLVVMMNRKLGKVVASEQTGFSTTDTNGIATTTIGMKTRFERGEGTETFVFQGEGEAMRLLSWKLQSDTVKDTPPPEDSEAAPAG